MIDYQAISNALLIIHSSIDDAISQLERSGDCIGYKNELELKEKEFDEVYQRLTTSLEQFSKGSERYLSVIADMKYGFKTDDIASEKPVQCLFPSNEVREFVSLINDIDRQIFDAFKRIGDIKANIVRIGRICVNTRGRPILREAFESVDRELERLIDEKTLFDHPVDEIEKALPINFSPEDKRFIELLVECTTAFPEKLADSLLYIRDAGRPYNW